MVDMVGMVDMVDIAMSPTMLVLSAMVHITPVLCMVIPTIITSDQLILNQKLILPLVIDVAMVTTMVMVMAMVTVATTQ